MTLLLWWFVAKVFSEPYQTHKMEFFVKLVNGLAVNYFRKKLHLNCLTWFWILLHLVSLGKIYENVICRNCLAKLWTDFFMDFLHWVKLIQKIFEFFIFFVKLINWIPFLSLICIINVPWKKYKLLLTFSELIICQ